MKHVRDGMTMGCKFSKISAEGAMFRRTRIRPLLLQQIEAMRTWRLPARPAKDTPSKKSLLLEEKPSQNTTVAMATVIGNTYGLKVSTKPKLHAQAEDGYDDDDQGRMIAPGSPSFRIFFEDAARDVHSEQIGQKEALKAIDSPPDVALSKEGSVQKKVKRERKMKRHNKSVIWGKRREAVKNLLNVKACICHHPSH